MKQRALICICLIVCMLCSACGNSELIPPPDNGGNGGGGGDLPAVEYILSFVTGTNETIAPVAKAAGASISAPSDPVRAGYVFKGWFESETSETPYVFNWMPAKNLTLTARWSRLYTLTFDAQNGQEIEPLVLEAGAFIVLPLAPIKEGSIFGGWMFGSDPAPLLMPAYSLVFTALWIDATASNVIVFSTGVGGLGVDPITAVAGAPITEPEPPLRAGYRFDGWYNGNTLFVFDFMPAQSLTLTAKWTQLPLLPVMRIQTTAVNSIMDVNRDTYIKTAISVEGCEQLSDDFQNAVAEFRGRGHGSWNDNAGTGKRGYRIKFEQKRPMFGIASSRHWVILACANQDDKSMAKNATAFGLGREVFDNMEYAPNTQWVEVYFNGDYRGVYVFSEQIRVASDRVDIESEYGVLDTGYLIEYDGYADNVGTGYAPMKAGVEQFRITPSASVDRTLVHAFAVKSPDPDGIAEGEITESAFRAQVSFIQEYTSRAMNAILSGDYATFSELCDVDSFVDMFLIQEYFKNKDCGFGSLYLYKKAGGKLYMGPVWDFDYSAGCYDGNRNPEGFFNVAGGANAYNLGLPWATTSQMFLALYDIPAFYAKVVSRWKVVSAGVKAYVSAFLSDAFIAEKMEVFAKNLYRYRAAYGGQYNTGNEANDMNHARSRWAARVTDLRTWLLSRAAWLDQNWV